MCMLVLQVREHSNPFSPQWYRKTLLSCSTPLTHTHTKHRNCCHAVLHGAMITLSSTGPYTLIHLYSILCRFPSHIQTQTVQEPLLTWWASWGESGIPNTHTRTHTPWSCWQALPRQINLVYSLIWVQIAPLQAHTYTHKSTHKYNITNNIWRSNELERWCHTHQQKHGHTV